MNRYCDQGVKRDYKHNHDIDTFTFLVSLSNEFTTIFTSIYLYNGLLIRDQVIASSNLSPSSRRRHGFSH